MVKEMATRIVQKDFKRSGWNKHRTDGSHSTWKCASGRHSVTLPDGHRTISPGVVRKAYAALQSCDCSQ